MKKEIPILFSTPMVQAILNDLKTMTRRLKGLEFINKNPDEWRMTDIFTHVGKFEREQYFFRFQSTFDSTFIDIPCPYGKPGDVLWVRETVSRFSFGGCFAYKADPQEDDEVIKWKPSIHMPKAACRIWLEVTDIRVERLQDISEEDAKAEGIEILKQEKEYTLYKAYSGPAMKGGFTKATIAFESLWCAINGEESWSANPWVWVVEFEVLSTTGKPILTHTNPAACYD